jgi:uncharacterized protein
VRVEVPWVDRPPAEIVREHFRLTLQPFDAPPDAASVEQLMEIIGSDKMLLYSSDYPHWHYEGTDVIPKGLSAAQTQRLCIDNPLETYPRLAASLA